MPLRPHEKELANSAREAQRSKVFAVIRQQRQEALAGLDRNNPADRVAMMVWVGIYGSLESAMKEAIGEDK